MRRLIILICLALLIPYYPGIVENDSRADVGALPQLPARLDTTYRSPTGKTINVAAGQDLQLALNEAQPGDEIVLAAGASYIGNFVLPIKSGAEFIHIRSSAMHDLPAPGTRVFPSFSTMMPKIISPNAVAALRTELGAHHYRLIGLEIGIAQDVSLNYGLIFFGSGANDQTSLDQVAHNLIIDRCYIHGNDLGSLSRGVALNSAASAVVDSYIANIHGAGFDTQAICGWNGPGPYKIVNNYLEGAGENVLFGGADPFIPQLVPADIEFRFNHLYKPLIWKADEPDYAQQDWTIKNLFELKNAQRVEIDGNVFEHNWPDAQNGFAILFTPRNQDGQAPWSVVRDVTFTNNIVRHVASAINILGNDDIYTSQPTERILIANNLFDDIGGERWSGRGRFLQMLNGAINVTVDHNTIFHTGDVVVADAQPSRGFVFTNNIARHNEYGVIGTGAGVGSNAIKTFFPDSKFEKNIFAGGDPNYFKDQPDNYFPAKIVDVNFIDIGGGNNLLSQASIYKKAGTSASDVGANIDEIERVVANNDNFVPASASSTSVRILFSTPARPNSILEYGKTTTYGKSVTLPPGSLGVTLLNLEPSSIYYYRVKTQDANSKTVITEGHRFVTYTTKPPIISDVTTSITKKKVVISWTTSEPTKSNLEFGTTITYGTSLTPNSEISTSHSVELTGLAANTIYHFKIQAASADGNISVINDQVFKTRRKR